jgi:hypothetical protein
LFYLFERFFVFYLRDSKEEFFKKVFKGNANPFLKKIIIPVLLIVFIGSSVGFSFSRFYKRFPMMKFVLGKDIKKEYGLLEGRALRIRRAKGMIVPLEQAQELESLAIITQKFISKKDKIFMYPEEGSLYFLMERPFYGRFPMATFSWFNESWHQELMASLKNDPPRYVILPKVFDAKYGENYFLNENNKKKFDDVMWFVADHYERKATTLKSGVYELKKTYAKRLKQNTSAHSVRRIR